MRSRPSGSGVASFIGPRIVVEADTVPACSVQWNGFGRHKGRAGRLSAAPPIPESYAPVGATRHPLPPSRRGPPGPGGFECAPDSHVSRLARVCSTAPRFAIGVLPDAGWRLRVGRTLCQMPGVTTHDGSRCRVCRRCGACGSRGSLLRCPVATRSPGRCTPGR